MKALRKKVEDVSEAFERAKKGTNILTYCFDGILLKNVEELDIESVVRDSACFEARIFSEDMEVLFLKKDTKTEAYLLEDTHTSDEITIDRKYEIVKNLRIKTKDSTLDTITVREYLAEDKDGQMDVVATRLVTLGKGA